MTRTTGRSTIGAMIALVVGCVACCAGPILAVLGAVTAGSVFAAVFVPALAVLAITSGGATAVLLWRRRARAAGACRSGVVDLPMPALGPDATRAAPAGRVPRPADHPQTSV